MGVFALLNHLLNFALPALFLAALLVGAGRALYGAAPAGWTLRRQWCVQAAVGVAVLLGGLVLTGSDGAMLTYALLVLVQATLQWWWAGRRRGAPPSA